MTEYWLVLSSTPRALRYRVGTILTKYWNMVEPTGAAEGSSMRTHVSARTHEKGVDHDPAFSQLSPTITVTLNSSLQLNHTPKHTPLLASPFSANSSWPSRGLTTPGYSSPKERWLIVCDMLNWRAECNQPTANTCNRQQATRQGQNNKQTNKQTKKQKTGKRNEPRKSERQ